jgi:uncharacterized membrane protein YdfJ with MMPL/SSD domain
VVTVARFVLRHRALVALFWLVALVAGAATAPGQRTETPTSSPVS